MFFQASYFVANRRAATFALRSVAPSNASNKKKKTVRFSGVDTVRYTHSPADYDRSVRRPTKSLRIDTQLGRMSGGPRFFTRLSTNYGRPVSDVEDQHKFFLAFP